MKYEFALLKPGIAGFEKKTGYPIGHAPEVTEFEASCHTEARVIAARMFNSVRRIAVEVPKYEGQVIGTPHYNVSRA